MLKQVQVPIQNSWFFLVKQQKQYEERGIKLMSLCRSDDLNKNLNVYIQGNFILFSPLFFFEYFYYIIIWKHWKMFSPRGGQSRVKTPASWWTFLKTCIMCCWCSCVSPTSAADQGKDRLLVVSGLLSHCLRTGLLGLIGQTLLNNMLVFKLTTFMSHSKHFGYLTK